MARLSPEPASDYLGHGFTWKEVELSLPLGLQLAASGWGEPCCGDVGGPYWLERLLLWILTDSLSPDTQLWPCPHPWTLDPPRCPSTIPLEPPGR